MPRYNAFQTCKRNGVPYYGNISFWAGSDTEANALITAAKPVGVVQISKVVETVGTNSEENTTDWNTLSKMSAFSDTNGSFFANTSKPLVLDNTSSQDVFNAVMLQTQCFEYEPTKKPKRVNNNIGGGNSRYATAEETTTVP